MQKRAKEERQKIMNDSPLDKVNWDAVSKALTSEGKPAAFLSQTACENWYFRSVGNMSITPSFGYGYLPP
jgi:hypothetical protein